MIMKSLLFDIISAHQRAFLQFPQISRILTAKSLKLGTKIIIGAVLAGFLATGLLPVLPADFFSFERAKTTVMLYPNDQSAHLFLAQEYLKRGNPEAVERELLLAANLSSLRPSSIFHLPSSSVLGASLSPLKILARIKNEPQRIRKEISFWEKVIEEKPDYRDAYLQLAILNYQLYENKKAQEYFRQATELDPNFEVSKELEKKLKN